MRFLPSHTVSAPSVHITYPPISLLKFPPASLPASLLPPVSDYTLARPFNIDPVWYSELLRVQYPITIALLYATIVVIWGRINEERRHKPWAISRTRIFYLFVLLHNISLALFSAWTFVGMVNAIIRSWPSLKSADGLPGVVDALCKINGPRGLGNAITFNSTTSSWGVTNKLIQLLDETPDNTDVGRLWNEGLAFYGWLFYLSKFYETFDTLIILAKGKKTSFLQTYHHAGAMFGMWAGIRYMAPPIWLFVVANSFVHSLMYIYYAITALGYRVPLAIKRSLTTLQISQFVVGVTFAMAHLFIAYNVPVNTPYLYGHKISSAIPSITSSISSVIASATATASADLAAWLKKIALRAAQQEGLAENVHYQGHRFGIDEEHAANVEKQREETRYRLEYPQVHCLDTSGQVFAVLLNAMYLAPLTYLFVNFFIRSYTARTSSAQRHPSHHPLKKAGHDALKGVERELHEATSGDLSDMSPRIMHGSVDDVKNYTKESYDTVITKTSESYEYTKAHAGSRISDTYEYTKASVVPKIEELTDSMFESYENIQAKVEPMVEDLKEEFINDYETTSKGFWDTVQKTFRRGSKISTDAAQKAQEAASTAADKASDWTSQAGDKVQAGREKAQPVVNEKAAQAANKVEETATSAKDTTNDVATTASQKVSEIQENAKPAAKEASAKATDKANEAADKAGETLQEGKRKGAEKTKETAERAQEAASDANDKAAEKVDEGADDIKQILAKADNSAYEGLEHIKNRMDDVDTEQGQENVNPEPLERLENERGKENGTEDELGDASALEASIEEIETPEEKKAEAEMEGSES